MLENTCDSYLSSLLNNLIANLPAPKPKYGLLVGICVNNLCDKTELETTNNYLH